MLPGQGVRLFESAVEAARKPFENAIKVTSNLGSDLINQGGYKRRPAFVGEVSPELIDSRFASHCNISVQRELLTPDALRRIALIARMKGICSLILSSNPSLPKNGAVTFEEAMQILKEVNIPMKGVRALQIGCELGHIQTDRAGWVEKVKEMIRSKPDFVTATALNHQKDICGLKVIRESLGSFSPLVVFAYPFTRTYVHPDFIQLMEPKEWNKLAVLPKGDEVRFKERALHIAMNNLEEFVTKAKEEKFFIAGSGVHCAANSLDEVSEIISNFDSLNVK